jgi:hypothetical protein
MNGSAALRVNPIVQDRFRRSSLLAGGIAEVSLVGVQELWQFGDDQRWQ